MTWMDWLLLALVALCGVLAIRSARRARKSGKCSGCGGNCAACRHKEKEEEYASGLRVSGGRSACQKSLSLRASPRREASALGVQTGVAIRFQNA